MAASLFLNTARAVSANYIGHINGTDCSFSACARKTTWRGVILPSTVSDVSPGRILKPKQDCVEKYFLSLYSNSQSRPVVSKRIPFAGEMCAQAAKGE